MAAKKPVVPLEQFSKAELIKLAKKLQRDVTRLQALVDVPPLRVTSVTPGDDAVSDLVPQAERPALPGVGPCKPFPWEPK